MSNKDYNHNLQREIDDYLNHFMFSNETVYRFKEELFEDFSGFREKDLVKELLFSLVSVVKDVQDDQDE